MNWRGFNCTIPHKVAVIPYLDRLNPAALTIGAVNCVVMSDGDLIGDNTDGKGFLESVSSIRPVSQSASSSSVPVARPGRSPSNWPSPAQRDHQR